MLVLSEEQTLLKSSAQQLFSTRAPVKALRRLRDEPNPEGYDRALWQEMVELGWAGILIPETLGGSGFGYQGLGQILEESGRTLTASPLHASSLIATTLLLHGASPRQQATWLPRLARGECLMALALDERPRHAPDAIETRAVRERDGYRLNGVKVFVPEGHVADTLLVVARLAGSDDSAGAPCVLLVPGDAPGLQRERLWMADSRNAARIRLHEVKVDSGALIGETAGIGRALETSLDAGRAGLAAEMLGSGSEAFERTLRYLKLREQFGVRIGSFQALKHRAAVMYCELELARSAVRAALEALDAGAADIAALASLCKAKACDMLELVSAEAIQMHGGIGMTDAEEIGFFIKRARVAQQMLGDASFHRDRYARLMGF